MKHFLLDALSRVQGLDWIGEVVTQHTGGVSGVGPPILTKVLLQTTVPLMSNPGSTTPITVVDVDDMVVKITKPRVGIFRPGKITLMVTYQVTN